MKRVLAVLMSVSYTHLIRPIDVANGPGIRVSLFVSGCTHACPECFNPEAWDFQYGNPFGPEQVEEIQMCIRDRVWAARESCRPACGTEDTKRPPVQPERRC